MNYIGISSTKVKPVAQVLNDLLSSYSVYYQNLRTFHWHVKGQNFFELHKMFEELYDDAKIKIDDIAERILTIGENPLSKMSEYLKQSKIDEAEFNYNDEFMVQTILENQVSLIKIMRKSLKKAERAGDDVTVDMLTVMLSETEKRTWMLSAWLTRIKS